MWKFNYSNQPSARRKPCFNLRSSVISDIMRGTIVPVHNGIIFKRIIVKRNRVGFKLGEFALTRKKYLKKSLKVKNNK